MSHLNVEEINRLQEILRSDDEWIEEECAGSPHHGSMRGDERRKIERQLRDAIAPEYSI